MPKKKPVTIPKLEPRDHLGLRAAMQGNVDGANIFVSFVRTELISLWLCAPLPERVKARLKALGSEADNLSHYLQGFADAKKEGDR